MKKLMTLTLGLAFLTGTVAMCYGQDTMKKTDDSTMKKSKKKSTKSTTKSTTTGTTH